MFGMIVSLSLLVGILLIMLQVNTRGRQRLSQGIAQAILRKWWSIGGHPGSSTGGDAGDTDSWKSLLTDDVVFVAPVEQGDVTGLFCSSFAGSLSLSLIFACPWDKVVCCCARTLFFSHVLQSVRSTHSVVSSPWLLSQRSRRWSIHS